MSTDPLGARLAEIRERGYRNGANGALGGRLSDCAAIDVPALLGALEAVLAAHHDSWGRCAWCRNPDGSLQAWPCGEYVTIRAALLGETGQ